MPYMCDGIVRDATGQTVREPPLPGRSAKYAKAVRRHKDNYGYKVPGNCSECGHALTEYIDVW